MATETALALLMVVSLAAMALVAALPASARRRLGGATDPDERRAADRGAGAVDGGEPDESDDPAVVRYREAGEPSDLRPAALDRIVRVAVWVFLFAVTTLVAVTDLWGDRRGAILVLLALGGIYTFVLHELVPPRVPDTFLLAFEGAMSVLLAAVLIALTGGAQSPFFFPLPLIVV